MNMMMRIKMMGGVSKVTDYDGNIYTPVVIGTQTWLVENLKTTHYNNGDAIPYKLNSSWGGTSAAWTDYGNSSVNGSTYGHLYNYAVIQDARGIAPVGYRVATLAEWRTLELAMSGSNAGMTMKEAGISHWAVGNNGTDAYGFKALGAGYMNGGSAVNFNLYSVWCTLDGFNNYVGHNQTSFQSGAQFGFDYGCSIRCIKI